MGIQECDGAFLSWQSAHLDEGFTTSVGIPGYCHQLDGEWGGGQAGGRYSCWGELQAWLQRKVWNGHCGAGRDGGVRGVGCICGAANKLGDLQLVDRNFGYRN